MAILGYRLSLFWAGRALIQVSSRYRVSLTKGQSDAQEGKDASCTCNGCCSDVVQVGRKRITKHPKGMYMYM